MNEERSIGWKVWNILEGSMRNVGLCPVVYMGRRGCSRRVVGNYAANRRFMLEIMIENLTNYKVATRRQKECC
ncbi:Serine--tRNA ligase [Dirofilaria immitis]